MTETEMDTVELAEAEGHVLHGFAFDYANASITQRLAAILGQLPAMGKTEWNDQQKFHYRSHDQVLNALNPLLAEYGVVVVPFVLKRVSGERTTSSNKTMYEVNLHVQYEFHGMAGDSITASAWGEGTDMGDKATNKAMTGAFKNALAQVFAISTEESIDQDSQTPQETTRGATPAPARAPRGPERPPQPPPGPPPAGSLLPGAISGEGYRARLAEAFKAIDSTVDWTTTVQPGIWQLYGAASPADLSEEQRPEYWRRMANAERKLRDLFPAGAFPPPDTDDEGVLEVLRWAFDGASIGQLELTPEAQAALEEALASGMADTEAAAAADTEKEEPHGEPPSTATAD